MSDNESSKRKADIFGDEDDDTSTTTVAQEETTTITNAPKVAKVEVAQPSTTQDPVVSDGKKEQTDVKTNDTTTGDVKPVSTSLSMDTVTAKVLGTTPYFRIYYLTETMFRDCLEIKEIKWKKTSHGHTAQIVFNNTRLQQWVKREKLAFHVNEKRYSPQRLNNFYFQTVTVGIPYGYSPSTPPNSKEVSNKLIADLTSFHDEQEMEKFIAGIEAMDNVLKAIAKILFADYQNGIQKKDLNEEFLEKLFDEKWKSPFKSSKSLTFALDTIKENEKNGIEADPYTAKLRVWDDNCEDKPIAEILSKENSCKYNPEEIRKKSKNKNEELPPQKIIIGQNSWGIIGAVLSRFFINDTCINYQLLTYDVFLKDPPALAKGNPLK